MMFARKENGVTRLNKRHGRENRCVQAGQGVLASDHTIPVQGGS